MIRKRITPDRSPQEKYHDRYFSDSTNPSFLHENDNMTRHEHDASKQVWTLY